ncbi:hypothetical protein [Roseibium album]|uniref:hypothetical protein n=1 Tax=Roseibium album TaxID=311410 RepID=UPI00248F76D8|nr:hypothetical protein [Roseibium album]
MEKLFVLVFLIHQAEADGSNSRENLLNIEMQEFTSEERCLAAADKIYNQHLHAPKEKNFSWLCVEK